MFLTHKENSLQTLSKDKRDILKAEPNCYLIEFDYDAFEYNILLDLLGIPKTKDPHTDTLKFLGLNVDRSIGKSINYSSLYGSSPEKVCENLLNDPITADFSFFDIITNFVPFERKSTGYRYLEYLNSI